jgi:hypothetical protein
MTKLQKKKFDAIMKLATNAANDAGDKWMSEHTSPAWAVMNGSQCVGTMLDCCGFGYVRITDKRTAFSKYIKEISNGHNYAVHVPHKYRMRQEMGLNEATAWAVYKVLTAHDIKGIDVYSRID